MANPAPTINQINAFNATQGTTIDFNIIGGTELVRSNRIYIYDLSDNSLICTHLYVSTESIHELPPNTDGSIVYESGKSSADFVNGAQYYAQIQTFTDIAGTEGGSGLSVAKMFWCLVDPTLTITTIPSTISTTSYNVSATYNANTSVVSNIIQQYQFSLYSATGSLLQSSGVVVGSGTQQGTSTAYDISYNFTGLSVGSSYYVVVDVTTTQGMSVSAQSGTFTVSIDTPTLGEATVVNNACDGYISVTSNLSSEYGGSGSGEIVSFETDSENVFTKLQVDLEPVQDLNGYDAPWVGGAGKNKLHATLTNAKANNVTAAGWTWNGNVATKSGVSFTIQTDDNDNVLSITVNGTNTGTANLYFTLYDITNSTGAFNGMILNGCPSGGGYNSYGLLLTNISTRAVYDHGSGVTIDNDDSGKVRVQIVVITNYTANNLVFRPMLRLATETDATFAPYENICPITGHDDVDVEHTGKNLNPYEGVNYIVSNTRERFFLKAGTYTFSTDTGNQLQTGENYYIRLYDAETDGNVITSGNITSDRLALNGDGTMYYGGAGYVTVTFTLLTDAWVCFGFNNLIPTTCTAIQLEVGSSHSAYEPYNGQTYHQDIEVTYTPTVQENDVYLFKQTGDVGGDRETIELVGGTVAWNQLCNPRASTSITTGVTITSSNGKYTINGTTVSGGGRTTPIAENVNIISGHKYMLLNTLTDTMFDYSFVTQNADSSKYMRFGAKSFNQFVVSATFDGLSTIGMNFTSGVTFNNNTFYIVLFDLTQMFGSTIADYIYSLEQANAGAGVAFFRKLFPKPYYAYNAGELMSVQASSHDMVGFNAWDEEWEAGTILASDGTNSSSTTEIRTKNYIQVQPSATYFAKVGNDTSSTLKARWYDKNKNYIGYEPTITYGHVFTVPSNASYLRFCPQATYGTTYKNDICINLSWDGERDGEYEPYKKHSYQLDSSLTLRGIPKLDNGNLYYDGDEYESDGNVKRRYGIVDLGTLSWTMTSTSGYGQFFHTTVSTKASGTENLISVLYDTKGRNNWTADIDRVIAGNKNTSQIYIKDARYSTEADFKTAMSGVYLVYELATSTTETADPFEEIQKVTPIYGTEEFVDNRTVPMPVYAKTQYLTRDVYGGYIDLVSGLLTVTHGIVDLGTLGWTYNSTSYAYAFFNSSAISTRKVGVLGDAYCSQYIINQGGRYSLGNATGQIASFNETNANAVCVRDDRYTDEVTFKQAMNGVQLVYPLAEPQTYQLTPQQIQTLVGVNNVWSEQGDIELSYHIPITNLLVKRQDVADVSGDWLTLYSQPITQASDMDFTFIDFTNQYGKTYKYALVPLLTQTQSGVEVEVEGGYTVSDEVQSVFDGVFIVDSTGSQKCKANVGYGNVDMNQAVGTITPIGAKYPVVITNSKNQYHNGSIYGTIVPDDYYFNGNLSRIDMVNKRDELEQFLTNKRAKIIKDWNGKIWLVMIMDNVSCTFNNNYGMGIVNFSTNWVEVGDPTNQQDLQATGLINVGGV